MMGSFVESSSGPMQHTNSPLTTSPPHCKMLDAELITQLGNICMCVVCFLLLNLALASQLLLTMALASQLPLRELSTTAI